MSNRQNTGVPPWGLFPLGVSSFARDLPIMVAGLAVFYGLLTFTIYGVGPANTQAEIQLVPGALPKYALFSVTRIAIAYFLSLGFALVYGYVAAYHAKAEKVLVPLLDILQSIPVLSFLPGVMVAMIALFPNRQVGVELGCIVLILGRNAGVEACPEPCFGPVKGWPKTFRNFAVRDTRFSPIFDCRSDLAVGVSSSARRKVFYCKEGLSGISRRPSHPTRDRSLAEIKAEHKKFAVDARRASGRIFIRWQEMETIKLAHN